MGNLEVFAMASTAHANLVGITGIARQLVMDGALDEAAAREAMEAATEAKRPLAQYLVDNRLVAPIQLAAANSVAFGIPVFDVTTMNPALSAIKLVSEELVRKHCVLPMFQRGGRLFVGIADPTNSRALDDVKFQTNLKVEPVLVDEERIRTTIDKWLESVESLNAAMGEGDEDEDFENLDVSAGDDDEIGGDTGVDAKGDDTPVVKFINKVLVDAIRKGASDIHFEPYEIEYRVRLRIDGILKQVAKVPVKMSPRISARLKVMSQLDIAEKRVPQDGRIKLNLSKSKQIDFRVSTLPTLFGEKIVLRILDGGAAKLGIEKLGYEDDQKQIFLEAVKKPYGMVLVTGPTGSGKTVSLYTALNILNDDSRNISTVEDPVEIRVPGINQVQMNTKRGMTFAAALRSFLRQDPDVIMVGEIRDLETAEIAVKAAQTGHMVLSTLHTNDAPQTIARLMNMGVAPFNITSSVTVVIAQRLARRLHDCKKEQELPASVLLEEGFTPEDIDAGLKIFEPVGCQDCTEGYKGRTGIYQVMPMSDEIQAIILASGNVQQITDAAARSGVRDLRQSALLKVKNGITSLAEINRVTKD